MLSLFTTGTWIVTKFALLAAQQSSKSEEVLEAWNILLLGKLQIEKMADSYLEETVLLGSGCQCPL